jgi:hypothetical protein
MGTWGPKLYQDDISEDVRCFYKDQLKLGKSNDEILNELIEQNAEIIADSDDAPIFWFALADTQWGYGLLLPYVKEAALKWLQEGSNIKRWEAENPKEVDTRKRVLKDLEIRLNSPQPPQKIVKQHRLYKCEWKIGDAFALKMESLYAEEKGLKGKFLLIQKVDDAIWHPGHITPVVYLLISNKLPKNDEDLLDAELVINSEYDGITYRRQLITTSKKVIPNDLIYVGKFKLLEPHNEFVRDKISITAWNWKELEKRLIDDYLMFNLTH